MPERCPRQCQPYPSAFSFFHPAARNGRVNRDLRRTTGDLLRIVQTISVLMSSWLHYLSPKPVCGFQQNSSRRASSRISPETNRSYSHNVRPHGKRAVALSVKSSGSPGLTKQADMAWYRHRAGRHLPVFQQTGTRPMSPQLALLPPSFKAASPHRYKTWPRKHA